MPGPGRDGWGEMDEKDDCAEDIVENVRQDDAEAEEQVEENEHVVERVGLTVATDSDALRSASLRLGVASSTERASA